MDSLNVKNINDEKIFNVIDPNGQGEVVNRIRPISISINQKAETINDQTDSTINLAVYWNDTWKSILDLTFDESLRQEYGKLTQDLTNIQKDIDMKQYKDAETKTNDFLKYVANLSSKYTAIPEKAVVSKIKNDFVKIKADKNSVKVAISDKLLNFMLKKYAKVDNLDYTKSNECWSTNKFNCLANNYDFYYHSPEIFQKQAYMTVVKDNKVIGSYKVDYDQFSKFASKFMLTPQKLGYSRDRLAGYMKTAEVVMQNIFFDSVDEAKEWQEMVDEKKKEQVETSNGEEETTEIKETETKTEKNIGEEGVSESPVKEDGGLARPSEDFASDEIPESEPRQQEQQGGGQNLGASKRVKNVKKIAAILFKINKSKTFEDKNKKVIVTIDRVDDSNVFYIDISAEYKDPEKANLNFEKKDIRIAPWQDETKSWVDFKDIEEYLKYTELYDDTEVLDGYGKYVADTIKDLIEIYHNPNVEGNVYPVLKASRRLNLLKKKAKVGYNAEPENELEEKAVEIGNEIMNVDWDFGYEIQGVREILWQQPEKKQEVEKKISAIDEKRKEAIRKIVEKYRKEFANEEIAKLVDEHLEDNNFHTASSIVSEFVDNEILASKINVDNDVKVEAEFDCIKEETQKLNNLNRKDKDFKELLMSLDKGIFSLDEYEKKIDSMTEEDRKAYFDWFYTRNNYVIHETELRDFLSNLARKYNVVAASKKVELNKQARTVNSKQDIKQILVEKQAKEYKRFNVIVKFNDKEEEYQFENDNEFLALDEALGYFGEKWHELPLANEIEKLEEVKVQELDVDDTVLNEYTKEYFIKNKDKFPKYSCNKKALYGDVQEQDIVPAKIETKVYLQSEDKESKTEKCFICEKEFPIKDMKKEKSVGYMCNDCIDKMKVNGYGLDIESLKKTKKNKAVSKKAEEQMVEEKIEETETSDTVKSKIGVGDIVTICIDKLGCPEEAFKYTEFIGEPLILMENDREDINKVIVEQTEYPFQRMTVNKDKIMQYSEFKAVDVIVEDEDGDEMITTFEELPVVAKQCKIKSIHKAARINKKKANLIKKAISSLEDVAGLIDDILSDYDWYDYADQLEVGEKSHYENILADLQKDEKGTIEALFNRVSEDDEEYSSPKIEQLKEYYNNKFVNGRK